VAKLLEGGSERKLAYGTHNVVVPETPHTAPRSVASQTNSSSLPGAPGDPPCLTGALDLLAKGLAPVVLRATGEVLHRDGQERLATGKEPRFADFGHIALCTNEARLREAWEQYPASGVGVLLGLYPDDPARTIKGLIDVEVDDPDAAQAPLSRIWPDEPPDTLRFESSASGRWHCLFALDSVTAARLREIGITQAVIKGLHTLPDGTRAGDPAYPGLEIRLGNLVPGQVSNTQSVVPPTPRADGTPRAWVGDVLLPVPEALIDDLALHSAVAVKHRATQAVEIAKLEPLPREELRGLTSLQKVLCQLTALEIPVRRTHSDSRYESYECGCPAHADSRPSFAISEGYDRATGDKNGNAVVKCFAGCTTEQIAHALGLWECDLFPENKAIAQYASRPQAGINTFRPGAPDAVLPDEVVEWFEAEQERCRGGLFMRRSKLVELSERLGGISTASLEALGVGWRKGNPTKDPDNPERFIQLGPAWTFPMFDGYEQVVNVQRRFEDDALPKRGMWQGQLGLFIPRGWRQMPGPIYLPEGASDTAALLDLGYRAIGRPSNTGGVRHAAQLLEDADVPVRIVGEWDARDAIWPGDPRPFCERLRRLLPDHNIDWVLPPEGCKDMREYLAAQSPRKEVRV